MAPKIDLTPWQLLERKLESSGDVRRILELAVAAGPHGIDLLVRRLRAMASEIGAGAPCPARTEGAPRTGADPMRPTPLH